MRYIEEELLPMLREKAPKHQRSAQKQLRQWKGEIHHDPEKMFVTQLRPALGAALAGGDAVPSVRANVGCAALCTLLGGFKQTFFPDKMPWLLQRLSQEELWALTPESIQEQAKKPVLFL